MTFNPSFEPSKQNAVKPLGSGEAVFSGLTRKFTDPTTHELPDSEQSDSKTEPHAHTPLKPVRPFIEPSQADTDPEGNPLVICKFCGDKVSRAWDEGNAKVKPGYRYLDRALANEGPYRARGGQATWWGSRGERHKLHNCRLETHQDQAI